MTNRLVDPFLILFLMTGLVIIWLWFKRVAAKRTMLLLTIPFVCLTLACLPLVAHFALGSLEWRYQAVEEPADLKAEAIVVLGGSVSPLDDDWQDYELNEDSLRRCLAAAKLYRRATGPRLLMVCGGKVDRERPGPTIAAAMREELLECGVDPTELVTEERSSTTYENAVEAAKLLKSRGISKVVLVTDAIHMLRAEQCFQAQGIAVVPHGTGYQASRFELSISTFLPSSIAARQIQRVTHEWVGLAWYKLKGRI